MPQRQSIRLHVLILPSANVVFYGELVFGETIVQAALRLSYIA